MKTKREKWYNVKNKKRPTLCESPNINIISRRCGASQLIRNKNNSIISNSTSCTHMRFCLATFEVKICCLCHLVKLVNFCYYKCARSLIIDRLSCQIFLQKFDWEVSILWFVLVLIIPAPFTNRGLRGASSIVPKRGIH